MLLGLIADTHGYLGPDAAIALAGCERLLHAGDIGTGVLEALRQLAPVTAVRGNNDLTGDDASLPLVVFEEHEGHRLALVHRLIDAPAEGWDILVFGHCHRRHSDSDGDLLRLNPGAAGRRGFHTTRSIALLTLEPGLRRVEFIDLGPRSKAA